MDGPARDNAEGGAFKEVRQVGANSAIIYGPDGQWVGGYRKTNLFETDKPWAKPGGCTSFFSCEISLISFLTPRHWLRDIRFTAPASNDELSDMYGPQPPPSQCMDFH